MNVYFITFGKKENSTEVPLIPNTIQPVAMQLKDRCSVRSPLLESKEYRVENYCYIPTWNRYYFVREKTYINGAWTYLLECDYLATWKTQIGNTSMFVLRSSTTYDGALIDGMYPLRSVNEVEDIEFGTLKSFRDGYFVISVIGANYNNGGEILYQMDAQTFQSVLTELLLQADGVQWGDLPQGAKLSVMNPTQYITSCRWYPYPFNVRLDSNDDPYEVAIKAGLWTSSTLVNIVSSYASVPVESYTLTDLPKHPQEDSLGTNLNLRPYSRYVMELGNFGCIELDPSLLVNCNAIQVDIYADQWTGVGKARILGRYTGDDNLLHFKLLSSMEAKYGVDIPLASSEGIRVGDIITTLAGAMTGFTGVMGLMGGPFSASALPSGIGAMAHGITSMESSMTGLATATSSIGMMVNHQIKKHLYCMFNRRVVGDNANNGKPLMQMRTPANLGGFMQVQKGVVSLPASEDEMNIVNRTLERGFYYE